MDMFDEVNFQMPCPKCGEVVTGFQSKDGPCILGRVEIKDINNFYSECTCGAWIEFNRPFPISDVREITPPPSGLKDAKALGYECEVSGGFAEHLLKHAKRNLKH